jgi:hypothetical protein
VGAAEVEGAPEGGFTGAGVGAAEVEGAPEGGFTGALLSFAQ